MVEFSTLLDMRIEAFVQVSYQLLWNLPELLVASASDAEMHVICCK